MGRIRAGQMMPAVLALVAMCLAGCGGGPSFIGGYDQNAFYDFGGTPDAGLSDPGITDQLRTDDELTPDDTDQADESVSPGDTGAIDDGNVKDQGGVDDGQITDSDVPTDEGGEDTTTPEPPAVFVADLGSSSLNNWETRAKALIAAATSSIDVAHLQFLMYSPSDISIADSIKAAAARGVKIRVLLDDDVDSSADRVRDLKAASTNIDAKVDDWSGTTHVKLIIVDDKDVLVGSTNLSKAALYHNNEANLWISEPVAVQAFSSYFDELFEDPGYQVSMNADWSNGVLPIGDNEYQANVAGLIDSAGSRVLLAMYDLNQDSSAAAALTARLGDAARRGVDVKVVLERCNESWAYYVTEDNLESADVLRDSGVKVRFDEPVAETDRVVTHTKLLVIDDSVIVYSGNWNNSGLRNNHEAGAIVTGVKQVSDAAASYFNTLWNEGSAL